MYEMRRSRSAGSSYPVLVSFALFAAAAGGPVACAEDDPPGEMAGMELDDEFDDDLSAWSVLNPEAADVRVESGVLVIEPAANSLWFNERAGVLVHQSVVGDFAMTALVTARRLSDDTRPPEPQFRLGGLMARDPAAAGGENYVFIVVGADGDDVSVETKNTTDGRSVFVGPPWPSGAGELRLCRIGERISAYIRDSASGTWSMQADSVRPDLPEVLQVGPMGYANAPDPDLSVRFDYVRFSEVTTTEDCLR